MSSNKLGMIDKSSIGLAAASVAIVAMCFSYAFAAPEQSYDEFGNATDQKYDNNSLINNKEYIEKTLKVYEPAIAKQEERKAAEEAARVAEEQAALEAEQEAQRQAALEAQAIESFQYTQYEYYDSYSNAETTYSVSSSNNGSFYSDGVWYDGNYRYTWYSSNALYHYRTSEWTAGSDGIYRDSDGYVVVASSTHNQGTVIQDTPFGAAKVYDSGCASGTLDVYTNY